MADQTPHRPIIIYGLRERFDCRIRYIGKTDNLWRRMRAHHRDRSRCHRTNWIRSVFARGGALEVVMLMRVPKWADWREAEKGWIDHGLRSGWPLTNGTYGGDGMTATPEVRAKISASRRGQKLSPEHRAKCIGNLRVCRKGDKLPESTRQAMSRARMGMQFTDAHCRQISEGKRRLSPAQVKEVVARLAAGESQSSVAKVFGVSQPTICAINKGKRKFMEAVHVA